MLYKKEILDNNKMLKSENEKLHSIMKEVREYVEEHTDEIGKRLIPRIDFSYNKLLEILDKENQ